MRHAQRLQRIEQLRDRSQHPDAELIETLRRHYPNLSEEVTDAELETIIQQSNNHGTE